MRLFDELITFPARDERGGEARPPRGADESCSEQPPGSDIARPAATTARHACARRADMNPGAFCRLVTIWIGAVAIVLAAALAVRWLA